MANCFRLPFVALSSEKLPTMPSLVPMGFNKKNQNKMMIFLDNEEYMDNDNLSFFDDSYEADVEPEVEQGDEEKKVCVSNEKENGMQPSKSHLQLRVLVNGEEISESDDSVGDDWVGEVLEDSKTVVTSMGRTSENTHPSFPKHIQMLPETRKHVEPRRPFQPVLGLWGTKRVSPTTSVSAWVKRAKEAKDSTKKQPKKKKKGKLTLSLKPKASLNPKQTIPPKKSIHTNLQNDLPLPNGDFQAWLLFGDNGGYSIAKDEWTRIRAWVSLIRSKKDFMAEAVTFHRLILSLKRDISLESARDS
jgi:hypothetical protein